MTSPSLAREGRVPIDRDSGRVVADAPCLTSCGRSLIKPSNLPSRTATQSKTSTFSRTRISPRSRRDRTDGRRPKLATPRSPTAKDTNQRQNLNLKAARPPRREGEEDKREGEGGLGSREHSLNRTTSSREKGQTRSVRGGLRARHVSGLRVDSPEGE